MLCGSAITRGYQKVIQEKFFYCWGHIHITPFLPDPSNFESTASVEMDSTLLRALKQHKDISSVHPFMFCPGVLQNKTGTEGILLKAIPAEGLQLFLQHYQTQAGPTALTDTGIYLSESIARKFGTKRNDAFRFYYYDEVLLVPRLRKLRVLGFFHTALEEFDQGIVLGNITHLTPYLNRPVNRIQGYELFLKNPAQQKAVAENLYRNVLPDTLQTYTMEQRFGNVFAWLDMMKMNERIIIIIMIIIAIVNLVSTLFIMSLDKTPMIGLLKTMGMRDRTIGQVFIYHSAFLLAIGILSGTALAWALCSLQEHLGILKLDEHSYYVKTVPVFLDWKAIIVIDSLTFLCGVLVLLVPVHIIRTISPVKAIRYE